VESLEIKRDHDRGTDRIVGPPPCREIGSAQMGGDDQVPLQISTRGLGPV
jgi:hypothetical protein